MKQVTLDQVLESQEIVLDVESTGLNVRKDKVIGIGLASSTGAIYITLYEWNGTELVATPELATINKTLIALKNKDIICHNAAYDLRIIKHSLGVDLLPQLAHDTILLKHTLDETYPFGLKDLAVKYAEHLGYEQDPTEEQKVLKQAIEAAGGKITKDCYELYKAPADIIGNYCVQDCKLTLDLLNFLLPQLNRQPKLLKFYNEEVMPLYKLVSIPMMERGIQLDMNMINRAQQEIGCELAQLEIEVQSKLEPHTAPFKAWVFEKEYAPSNKGAFAKNLVDLHNLPLPQTKTGAPSLAKGAIESLPPSCFKQFLLTGNGLTAKQIEEVQVKMHDAQGNYFINIKSKDHLKRIIFNYLGEKPFRFTDKGAWQLDDNFLQSIQHKYSFIPPLLVYNKLSKIKSTYIDRFVEQQEDGIFYPQFNQHRTISGRFGSDIQQLPRPKEEGDALVMRYNNMIRNFFISRDGHSFIDDDYESLEPHIFAHVSGDPGLQAIFNNGEDFYSKIAIMTEGLKGVSADKKADNYLGKVSKAVRQKAKAYSLGIPYGLESYKLHKELNISQDEAVRLINQYLNAFPELKKWMERTDIMVKTKGMVETEVGRQRRVPEAVRIYSEYGDSILDSLQLWKDYHEHKDLYKEMKDLRYKYKNFINNGRNFQIQSLAASVVNRACIAIAKKFTSLNLDAHILAQVHDEILVECKDEDIEKVSEIVQSCMENVMTLSVKLKAPPSVAKCYGDAKG